MATCFVMASASRASRRTSSLSGAVLAFLARRCRPRALARCPSPTAVSGSSGSTARAAAAITVPATAADLRWVAGFLSANLPRTVPLCAVIMAGTCGPPFAAPNDAMAAAAAWGVGIASGRRAASRPVGALHWRGAPACLPGLNLSMTGALLRGAVTGDCVAGVSPRRGSASSATRGVRAAAARGRLTRWLGVDVPAAADAPPPAYLATLIVFALPLSGASKTLPAAVLVAPVEARGLERRPPSLSTSPVGGVLFLAAARHAPWVQECGAAAVATATYRRERWALGAGLGTPLGCTTRRAARARQWRPCRRRRRHATCHVAGCWLARSATGGGEQNRLKSSHSHRLALYSAGRRTPVPAAPKSANQPESRKSPQAGTPMAESATGMMPAVMGDEAPGAQD
eukprot:COSAG01_NODE_12648_length_1704_cov_1.763863_1_plen_399_part_10